MKLPDWLRLMKSDRNTEKGRRELDDLKDISAEKVRRMERLRVEILKVERKL